MNRPHRRVLVRLRRRGQARNERLDVGSRVPQRVVELVASQRVHQRDGYTRIQRLRRSAGDHADSECATPLWRSRCGRRGTATRAGATRPAGDAAQRKRTRRSADHELAPRDPSLLARFSPSAHFDPSPSPTPRSREPAPAGCPIVLSYGCTVNLPNAAATGGFDTPQHQTYRAGDCAATGANETETRRKASAHGMRRVAPSRSERSRSFAIGVALC